MSSPASSSDEHEDTEISKETKPSTLEEEKDEEKAKNDDDSGSDSNDEENEEVGLLDRPVEVSGSRERKKVQRLELSFNTPSKEKQEIPEGSGEKLGDCPRIEHQLQKKKVNDLKLLHRILFGRVGSAHEIKKNIKKFSGFTFAKDSAEYERKKASLDKMSVSDLKQVCEILDLERSGAKDDIANRILEFALHPKNSGKGVPKKKTSGRGTKRKREDKTNAGTSSKQKTNSSEDNEEASENNESDEASDEDKVKKSKRSQQKMPKNADKKKAASKKKVSSSSDDDDSSLIKAAKSRPTDAEIKALVKKILQSADLQEITMKKVIKQVYDGYPDFDLSDKKDFIKATVKSVIS